LKRIRVVVAATPRVLRDIIEGALRLQSDMELIDGDDEPNLSEALKRCAADVVVVAGRPPQGAASYEQLLIENPQVKVLVVTDDGGRAHLIECRRIPVAEVTPQGLVDAIRSAVAVGPQTRLEDG
jgi:DNA-binding NarL/FixJ family response regulator